MHNIDINFVSIVTLQKTCIYISYFLMGFILMRALSHLYINACITISLLCGYLTCISLSLPALI